MINAASELERWVPDIAHENAVRLFAQPLFEGILSSGAAGAAPPPGRELVNEHRDKSCGVRRSLFAAPCAEARSDDSIFGCSRSAPPLPFLSDGRILST